ncbi:signal peptidase II [Bacillaceae bacterium S4-13-58]
MQRIFIWFILIFLGIDLITKTWAEFTLRIGEKKETIIPYINWHLLHNKGMSFSILDDYPDVVFVINLIAVVVVGILLSKLMKSFVWYLAGALIIGGALGNFVNRLFLGHVIDFISVKGYPAIFNVADIEIRIGMVLILFLSIKEYITEKRKIRGT